MIWCTKTYAQRERERETETERQRDRERESERETERETERDRERQRKRQRKRQSFSFSFSVSAQDGIVALGKPHTRSAPSLSSLPKVSLETVPIFAWLNTDRSRPWRVECWPLLFSTPLSFRQSMLWCSGLSVLRKFLKPLSTSANTVARVGIELPAQVAQVEIAQLAVCWCRPCQLPLAGSSCLLFCLYFSNLSISLNMHRSAPFFQFW